MAASRDYPSTLCSILNSWSGWNSVKKGLAFFLCGQRNEGPVGLKAGTWQQAGPPVSSIAATQGDDDGKALPMDAATTRRQPLSGKGGRRPLVRQRAGRLRPAGSPSPVEGAQEHGDEGRAEVPGRGHPGIQGDDRAGRPMLPGMRRGAPQERHGPMHAPAHPHRRHPVKAVHRAAEDALPGMRVVPGGSHPLQGGGPHADAFEPCQYNGQWDPRFYAASIVSGLYARALSKRSKNSSIASAGTRSPMDSCGR